MFFFRSKWQFLWFVLLLFFTCGLINAAPGKITGSVLDIHNKQSLPGANIIIKGTTMGAAADVDGHYSIVNIPSGSYTLRVSYIGYKSQEINIQVRDGVQIEHNFVLEPEEIEGETVIITAQREGQMAAINQQIAASAIKNIVSSDKIQELPESNAAEAVGRLPGVSLQREGGEGNKVVIRGLAPKYNKVQIDGVDMAATGSEDRSTDMSMISPYMLDGIEVTKSAMADQDADQLGGTVNFVLKGASSSEPIYNIITEGGYNGLRQEYKDFKVAGLTSQRVFDDLIGISLNVDFEKRNRSSNTVSAGYKYLPTISNVVVNSLYIEDISRKLDRYNGSLVLDYKTPTTTIILSNMFSRIDRNTISRGENTTNLHGSTYRNEYLNTAESNTTILMNQLRLEQEIGDFSIEAGVSYSYSKDNVPEGLQFGGEEASPKTGDLPAGTTPAQVPNYMKNDVSAIFLTEFIDSDELTKEDELGAFIDLKWEYRLSDDINIKLQTGGKYKHQSREYDYNSLMLNMADDPSSTANQAILAKWPWMANYSTGGSFRFEPFIDYNYDPGDFMRGEYSLQRIPSLEMGVELIHYLEDALGIKWDGFSRNPEWFAPNFHDSKRNDYNGKEDYGALYFMPTFSFGETLTFIPGLRYEHEKTVYTGIRGDARQTSSYQKYNYHEKEVTRENEYFLPMIHARYKPLDWFDVRVSYTQTLTRPSYREFLPSWHIDGPPLSLTYSNPNLRPAKSENYDLYFSVYGNKVGLFTVGLFSKRIDGLIFSEDKTILSDTMAIEEFGLVPEEGVNPLEFKRRPISTYTNNPNKTDVYGVEVEWQSNLWFLPGLLKNIVFGINYTYTHSETKYPRFVPIKDKRTLLIVGNADSAYSAPMLYQPDHILNITLGYDYEGFSIRGSMQYKSRIFSENDWYPGLRGYTDDFTIFDLAVSQKLPIQGLSLYGNLKNITKTIETDINEGTGYMSNKEYYGLGGNLGIRYEF